MIKVELNHSNENPFYGLRNCLQLFQEQTSIVTTTKLDACWNEVKDNKQHREMFFSLLFSFGDITNRQHNIFKKIKRDSGGNSNRESFWIIFNWLRENHFEQFERFLNAGLFNEYSCFDLLFRSRVQTTRNGKVIQVYDVFSDHNYCQALLNYLYKVINGNNVFDKHLIAKFLTIPRLSKRQGHKRMLPETEKVMAHKEAFLIHLSNLVGWEYEDHSNYTIFTGYRRWRQQYNQNLESVLFSTGRIKEFDRTSFINWFDQLPAQARFRVKNRILYSKNENESLKYAHMISWYQEWEKYKEEKQAEQRVLEEKVRQGEASEDDVIKLEKVKKQAKVNVGATNFKDLYTDICYNRVDKLKLESFINKVNLPYNSLVIIDDSGSMTGQPFNFACFIAAVCLCKNPDDDGRNLLGFFNDHSHWHSHINQTTRNSRNSILRTQVAKTKAEPFVDPLLSFYENYQRISNFCSAVFEGGCTNISSIPENLNRICQHNPAVLDALRNYPVWTIISDGEWNNLHSPEASMNDFMRRCENYFGFRPFIVAIDIEGGWGFNVRNVDIAQFSGIDNFMYIPSNPAQIEQFLTNFKDMDVFDVYTPLQSIFRSNRYDIVRSLVL